MKPIIQELEQLRAKWHADATSAKNKAEEIKAAGNIDYEAIKALGVATGILKCMQDLDKFVEELTTYK